MASAHSNRPRVTCYADVDLVHAAHPVTGLIELADSGEIDLRFQLRDRSIREFRGNWTLWLRVDSSNEARLIAIDLHDRADYLSESSLRHCTQYFKVNLSERTLAVAPDALSSKLRPYGPYFPCRPLQDRALGKRWLGNLLTKSRHRLFHSSKGHSWASRVRTIAGELFRHRRYLSRKTWIDYEVSPEVVGDVDPKRTRLVFNPLCWDEAEGTEIRTMNELRSELIVALRREFRDRFVGGFRNHGPSVSRYPEAVEPRAISHDDYVALTQESRLVVYLNGKFGCISWRLAEAFAAAQCIVSERIPNDAGFPLDEDVGCIQCDDVPGMIAALRELLEKPDVLREMSQRSYAQYVDRLRPQARMRRLLHESLGRLPIVATSTLSPPLNQSPP